MVRLLRENLGVFQLEWVQNQGEEGGDFCVNYENSWGGMISRLG